MKQPFHRGVVACGKRGRINRIFTATLDSGREKSQFAALDSEVMMLRNFVNWLNAALPGDTAAAPVRRVVGRFARGNVLLQRGRYITQADASTIVRKGDRAIAKLDRLAPKH